MYPALSYLLPLFAFGGFFSLTAAFGQGPEHATDGSPVSAKIINVRDLGAKGDGVTDDAPAIQRAVDEAKKLDPPASVYLPTGNYLCASANIRLSGCRDLTFYGRGVTSILIQKDPEKHVIDLSDDSRVTVKQLTLDRTDDYFTQGTIDSVDATTKTVEVTLDPGYLPPDTPSLVGDSDIRVFRAPDCGYYAQVALVKTGTRLEKLGEGRWRFHLDGIGDDFAGRKFIFWTDCHGGHGVNGSRCRDCLFEDITYYGKGANAGILLGRCEGTMTFRRFHIDVPPGSRGLLSCSGGGMEIDVRGKLVYEDCDFERFDDDGADVTTHYVPIVEQAAPDRIIVGDGVDFRVGDRLARINWVTKNEQGGFKITAVAPVPGKQQVALTLDRPMTVGKTGTDRPHAPFEEVLKNGIDRVVDYDDATTSTEFRHCKFQCLRARPLNLKAQNCLVEDCTFSNSEGQAISAGPEAYWMEAPSIHHLTIRGCTFVNNATTCIDVDFFQGMQECVSYGNQDILIEGNVFRRSGACYRTPGLPAPGDWRATENFGALAIHVHHCANVVICDNDFGDRAPTAPSFKPMVLVADCQGATVENNRNLPAVELKQDEGSMADKAKTAAVQLPVWPGLAPGESTSNPGVPADQSGHVARFTDVTAPSLYVYPQAGTSPGPAVLILPGGGYEILSTDLEGSEIARWLHGLGYTVAVLHYRVPHNREGALQDGQRALSLLRARAGEFGIDPARLGVMGFSAGGHLAARLSAGDTKRAYAPLDASDEQNCRPDFTMLIYPAYLRGKEPESVAPEVRPGPGTPPVFLAQTRDDANLSTPPYAKALAEQGVAVEDHLYESGGHGYGLRLQPDVPAARWSVDAADWLRKTAPLPAPPRS